MINPLVDFFQFVADFITVLPLPIVAFLYLSICLFFLLSFVKLLGWLL